MPMRFKPAALAALTAAAGGVLVLMRRGLVDYDTSGGQRLSLPALLPPERELVDLVEKMLE